MQRFFSPRANNSRPSTSATSRTVARHQTPRDLPQPGNHPNPNNDSQFFLANPPRLKGWQALQSIIQTPDKWQVKLFQNYIQTTLGISLSYGTADMLLEQVFLTLEELANRLDYSESAKRTELNTDMLYSPILLYAPTVLARTDLGQLSTDTVKQILSTIPVLFYPSFRDPYNNNTLYFDITRKLPLDPSY
eukprot:3381512-Rhodomonas_salina.1